MNVSAARRPDRTAICLWCVGGARLTLTLKGCEMRSVEQVSNTDRSIGIGGLILAVVALASTTQRIDVSVEAEVVPAIVGMLMVLWVLLATVRHHRAHRGGRGRTWLIAGWVALGINLVWSVFQALDTAAFDDGLWHGLAELATGPPILMVLVPLVLSSIAILRDGADPQPEQISPGER
mgnify:CR=1 FL=1